MRKGEQHVLSIEFGTRSIACERMIQSPPQSNRDGEAEELPSPLCHDAPAYNVFQMQTLVDRSTAQRRFLMMLLSAFASTSILLAALGIYGTISQTVSHRTREIGLRLALGASRREAFRLVLNEGFQLTLIGVPIGAATSLLLTRLMRGVLFGIGPSIRLRS